MKNTFELGTSEAVLAPAYMKTHSESVAETGYMTMCMVALAGKSGAGSARRVAQ